MPTISTRLLLGFLAGVLSTLIFQGGFGAILYAAHVTQSLPWSLDPVPPFGVPKTVSSCFWAGLWGLVYVLLEPRLTARFGWWLGGILFGIGPIIVLWFVVLPLKGLGVGGGFHPASVPIVIASHLLFGLGVAIILRAELALAGRRVSPHG
jgi:hypothetical protein